jgi:dihydrolipoamide dehydrogenase
MNRFCVEVINARGEILEFPSGEKPAIVRAISHDGTPALHEGKTIMICAGSAPVLPPIPGAKDNPLVADSTGLLAIEYIPKRLAIIGGGVIGVEFAGLFAALGSSVTVIEMMDEIVPFMDREQPVEIQRGDVPPLKAVEFKLGFRVERVDGSTVHYKDKIGTTEKKEADIILLAVGRQPVLDTWGSVISKVGTVIDTSPKGITVNDRMRTNIPGIWAAGDVTGKSLLAHAAYRMAEVAVTDILPALDGGDSFSKPANVMRYCAVPWAVYGITEAAGVGITEQEAAARGIKIIKASLPMKVSGRFIAENSSNRQGAVKVIADAENHRILGVHAVGAYATEFIWGGAALIEQEFRIEDVKQLIFPHPTVSELIRDVVWEIK